jgi:hypothetical protein
MTDAIRSGCLAAIVLTACGGDEQASSLDNRTPWVAVDRISNPRGGLREAAYRNAITGERYAMQVSDGEAGFIESRPTQDDSESVRIEWTPTSVRVIASHGDGPAQFWFVSRSRGLDKIDVRGNQTEKAGENLPFLLRSATHADVLLGSSRLATPLGVARMLTTQGPSPLTPIAAPAAVTLPCDNTIDISGGCAQEAKLKVANKDIFSVPAGTWLDGNTMKLSCGTDGRINVQACPVDAYDCTKFPGAKTEGTLTVSDAQDDTNWRSNEACGILRNENEGIDVGKKFNVKGSAELRPGKPVRPKDSPDEARSPLNCKLEWSFPNGSDDIYHSQWEQQGHSRDTTHPSKWEVALTTTTETGNNSLAIGGKIDINADVQTCQDSDVGRDDYAIVVRGWRTNQLYHCNGDTTPPPNACSTNDCGVVFVHGTSDRTPESAKTDYWTQDTIDKIRGGKPYLVVGYPGESKAGFEAASWGGIIDQIAVWLGANTTITNYVVVTHSNGVNPMRYALVHPTSNTPGGRRVDTVTTKMRKMIPAGGSMKGTPLANAVTDTGGLGQIANWVSTNFFNNNWNVPGVWQQRTERMGQCAQGHTPGTATCSGYNGDGTFGGPTDCYMGATTCGGKPLKTVIGKSVTAEPTSADAQCGGLAASVGLRATQCYGFGCDSCSDGFIGCDSQSYLGTKLQEQEKLSHHQERRDCQGVPLNIKNDITNTSW